MVLPDRLGPIFLGCRPADVTAVLGERPKYEDWMGGNLNGSLCYHGLMFDFDACDSRAPLPGSRLAGIHVFGRDDAVLFGQRLRRWRCGPLSRELDRQNVDHFKTGDTDLLCPASKTEFGFDSDGWLESIWLEET